MKLPFNDILYDILCKLSQWFIFERCRKRANWENPISRMFLLFGKVPTQISFVFRDYTTHQDAFTQFILYNVII